jgi:hypothetical protein
MEQGIGQTIYPTPKLGGFSDGFSNGFNITE